MFFHNDPPYLLLIQPDTSFSKSLRNPSVLPSGSHLRNIDFITDQYSTPATPNRVDYPSIVNDFLSVRLHPRQDPRFFYLATHKFNSNTHISEERRRKEFRRLDSTNLEIKFEIISKFHVQALIRLLFILL